MRILAEAEKIHAAMESIIDEHGLLYKDYVVAGSAAMAVHGLDRGKQIGDIDLFLTTDAWFDMLRNDEWNCFVPREIDHRRHDPPYLYQLFPWDLDGADVMAINVFFAWRERDHANISVIELFETAEQIEGLTVCNMDWLLGWKREANRGKDGADIKLLERFLEENPDAIDQDKFRRMVFFGEE